MIYCWHQGSCIGETMSDF